MKRHLTDLAVFGGEPAFRDAFHVGRPYVADPERFLERMREVLGRGWLSNNGPLVRELEARLAAFLGVAHCVCVSSATAGLDLCVRVLGLSGAVVMPSFTFVAGAHVLAGAGLRPVFCDVDPATHNLDPRRVEEVLTEDTTAILAAHTWGRACDVEALEALAARRGLRLLFDAAGALGCSWRGRLVGGNGAAEVFSLHATKVLNTFEGGAVATQDLRLAEALRRARNFGFREPDWCDGWGTNAKMSEASAAMGLTNLEGLDEIVRANERNYRAYRRCLSGLPGWRLADVPETERSTFHHVVFEVDADEAGLTRDEFMTVLRAERVLTRRYFDPPCHQQGPYRGSAEEGSLHVTEALCRRVLCLPTGTAVREGDVEAIARIVAFVGSRAGDVALRLSRGGS